jgi:hypothetical protein
MPDDVQSLDEKQQEILMTEKITITDVHQNKEDGLYHCNIFGF